MCRQPEYPLSKAWTGSGLPSLAQALLILEAMSTTVRHLGVLICLFLATGCGKKKLQNFALKLGDSNTLTLGSKVLEIYRTVNTNKECPADVFTVMLGETATYAGAYTRLDLSFYGEPPMNENIALTERPRQEGSAVSVGRTGFYISLDAVAIENLSTASGPKVASADVTFLNFGKNNGDSIEIQFNLSLENGESASGVISGPLTVETSTQCNRFY